MAKVKIFECDLCGREIRYQDWWDSPGHLTLKCSGHNVQFSIEKAEVCLQCTARFSRAISDVLAQISMGEATQK